MIIQNKSITAKTIILIDLLAMVLFMTLSTKVYAQSLVWNTFMGSTVNDHGSSIAVDQSGNVYVAGDSLATWGSPVNPFAGQYDVYVAKLDANGNWLWAIQTGGD